MTKNKSQTVHIKFQVKQKNKEQSLHDYNLEHMIYHFKKNIRNRFEVLRDEFEKKTAKNQETKKTKLDTIT